MSHIQRLLRDLFGQISLRVSHDSEFKASSRGVRCTFVIASSDDPKNAIVVGIENGGAMFDAGPSHAGAFGLQARPEDWDAFFAKDLIRPYQSYWGILRVLGHNDGIEILGDQHSFGHHARLWRLVLDCARDVVHGKDIMDAVDDIPADEVNEEDSVVGRYFWTELSEYGKVKVFYERAGSGPQDLLFLHTAGSDSRQYHSLMNKKELQERCTMYAFDLPAHGRSSLGTRQFPQGYALNEASYLEVMDKVIKHLKLQRPIVCGASMAGLICLSAAMRCRTLGIGGAIPCEAFQHLAFDQPIYEIKGADTSLLDPERVIGMCSPTSPAYFKKQIFHQYSSQSYGMFAGDLKFYFKGWDGRGRVETIDTKMCPCYLLTGQYDYSCTTEASEETASKIEGARFEAMEGLGHFPLTEHPSAVMPYLMRALDWIRDQHASAS